jgi:hypothetical protein
MGREKFDVDKLIAELEQSDDPFLDEATRFAECPKCGSDTWDKLYYSDKGTIKNCNECCGEHEQ